MQQSVINGLSEGEEQVFDTIKSEVVSSIMQQGLFYADEIIDEKIEELEKSNSLSAVGLEIIRDSLHTIPKVITLTATRQPEETVKTVVAESNSKDWIIPCNGKITSPFGWRIDPITKNKTWHNGWDIKADIGTVFVAIADGKISFAGKSDPTGYAHYIVIDHGKINGKFVTSEYGHISKHYYPAGTEVKKGQPIGETGNEGKSTKPHLHLTIRESKSKKRGIGVNPSLYIKR